MRIAGNIVPPSRVVCEHHWGHPRMGVGVEHRHEEHELILVARGRYRARIAGEVWSAEAGEAFLYPPGCVHHPLPERVRSSRFWLLRWRGGAAGLGTVASRHHDADRRLGLLCAWLEAETSGTSPRPTSLALALWWAVVEILRRGQDQEPQPEGPIARLRHIITRLPANPLSLGELADLVGLSPSQLVRRCRAETGQTPMRLLRRERIERAARLLAAEDLPLSEVARQVGLADAAHLSHLFQAERGEAPGVFRGRVRRQRRNAE